MLKSSKGLFILYYVYIFTIYLLFLFEKKGIHTMRKIGRIICFLLMLLILFITLVSMYMAFVAKSYIIAIGCIPLIAVEYAALKLWYIEEKEYLL